MHPAFALIGGTGIGNRLAALGGNPIYVPTEYGGMRGKIVEYEGVNLILVQRHAAGHRTPPHLVNYKAVACALKQLGVRGCVSSAAVGCLRPEWEIGTLAVCDDFLDLTGRRVTLFDRTVEHTDFSHPFGLDGAIRDSAKTLGIDVQHSATYLAADGPRYETPAEIKMMKGFGADLVGMTASTEAIALGEAGVPYGCIGVVTNLAAGLSETPLHHGEVVDVMKERGQLVVDIMLRTARDVALG